LQRLGVKKVPFNFTDQGTRQIELNHI